MPRQGASDEYPQYVFTKEKKKKKDHPVLSYDVTFISFFQIDWSYVFIFSLFLTDVSYDFILTLFLIDWTYNVILYFIPV